MSLNAPTAQAATIPEDVLAALVGVDAQKLAARMAQDGFAKVFRLSLEADDEARAAAVAALAEAIGNWSRAAGDEDAAALRMALVVTGLDQWGLAYTQAFGLAGIPALSELIGALRTGLDARGDARFQTQFAAVEAVEGNAIDFKVDLRRGIHLALWHAMIASEEREQASAILVRLGGMMFALVQQMPSLGWRLVADALANIQIQCLAEGLAAEGLSSEMNASLFASLASELPADCRDRVMAHAAQAVMAWQQARRQSSTTQH